MRFSGRDYLGQRDIEIKVGSAEPLRKCILGEKSNGLSFHGENFYLQLDATDQELRIIRDSINFLLGD